MIKLKRVYEPAAKDDGLRVLVDRLWPRGLSREKAGVALWLKDAAPSDSLRKWFSHDRDKWPEFRRKYVRELKTKKDPLKPLNGSGAGKDLTLLYAAKDEECNNAVVLKEFIDQKGGINGSKKESKSEKNKGFLENEKRLPA